MSMESLVGQCRLDADILSRISPERDAKRNDFKMKSEVSALLQGS
jgi:hypothetical protein